MVVQHRGTAIVVPLCFVQLKRFKMSKDTNDNTLYVQNYQVASILV